LSILKSISNKIKEIGMSRTWTSQDRIIELANYIFDE
jgi:hypothetical protein